MRVVAAGAIEAGITAVQNGDGAKAIDGCELLGAGGGAQPGNPHAKARFVSALKGGPRADGVAVLGY